MRELSSNETATVAGAGIVTDDPQLSVALDAFDAFCGVAGTVSSSATTPVGKLIDGLYLPTPGPGAANAAVHLAVDTIDDAFTRMMKAVMGMFG